MFRLHPLFMLLFTVRAWSAETGSGWARLFSPELRDVDRRRAEIAGELEPLPEARLRAGILPVGFRSEPAPQAETEKWVQVDLGREYPVDDIVLVPAWFRFGDFPGPGFGFPMRFRVETAAGGKFDAPETVADFTAADFANPGLAPVPVRVGGKPARFVRVTATKLWRRIDDFVFALGELHVIAGNRNRAWRREAAASDSFESPGMWSRGFLTDDSSVLGNPTDVQMQPTNGHHSIEHHSAQALHVVEVDLGSAIPVDEVRLIAARPVDYPDTIGFGFPPRFRLEGAQGKDLEDPVMLADHTAEEFPNPGDKPVVISGGGKTVRYVRLTATQLWQRDENTWVMALAEMQVMSGGRNAAAERPVGVSDTVDTGLWRPQFLVDGIAPRAGMGNIAGWLGALARRLALESELATLDARRAVLVQQAEARLLWSAGGLVGAAVMVSFLLHRRSKARVSREARKLRQDIAQDLHDEVGSNLGSIAILSQLALDASPDGEAMRGEVEEIHRVAQETTESMRDIVWLISPGEKTTDDLAERLRNGAASLLAGMEWNWNVSGLRGTLSLSAQRDVLLILKEALHNVRKHAGAGKVDIRLSEAGGEFRMEIEDDGRGFDPASAAGRGLANMQRRAQRMGGILVIQSEAGKGTALRLSLPLKSPMTKSG